MARKSITDRDLPDICGVAQITATDISRAAEGFKLQTDARIREQIPKFMLQRLTDIKIED